MSKYEKIKNSDLVTANVVTDWWPNRKNQENMKYLISLIEQMKELIIESRNNLKDWYHGKIDLYDNVDPLLEKALKLLEGE